MKKLMGTLKGLLPATRRQRLVYLLALGFLVATAVPVISRVLSDGQRSDSLQDEILTYSTDTPDETPPGPNYPWRGQPQDPKKIIIPSLAVDGFIQKVGVDQNQQVTVPSNIHLAGWFVDSVRPGQPGLSIIDGHVDGRTTAAGIFGRLGELRRGDRFRIKRGDGQVLRYRVLDRVESDLDEAASVLFTQDLHVSSQLNLITCSGRYDRTAKTYDKRIIVSAELLEND